MPPGGSSGGPSTDPTTGENPSCPGAEQLCNGVCTKIWRDEHACGPACIDCTELHGNDARCKDGVCEPHEGKGDD